MKLKSIVLSSLVLFICVQTIARKKEVDSFIRRKNNQRMAYLW